jgi:hypothetical protein
MSHTARRRLEMSELSAAPQGSPRPHAPANGWQDRDLAWCRRRCGPDPLIAEWLTGCRQVTGTSADSNATAAEPADTHGNGHRTRAQQPGCGRPIHSRHQRGRRGGSLSATFLPTDVCEQGPLMDSPYGSGRTVIGPSPPSTNAIASRSPDRLRIRRCGAGDVTATEPANAW